MAFEELRLAKLLKVPNSDCPIPANRYNLLSQLVKVQAENFVLVASEGKGLLPSLEVECFDVEIVSTGHNEVFLLRTEP